MLTHHICNTTVVNPIVFGISKTEEENFLNRNVPENEEENQITLFSSVKLNELSGEILDELKILAEVNIPEDKKTAIINKIEQFYHIKLSKSLKRRNKYFVF